MQIYHYHQTTGGYLFNGQAQEDPLNPGRYLVPANATPIAPPVAGANEAAVFDPATGIWSIVPDYRGETWYSTADGSEAIINELGQPDVVLTSMPRPGEWYVWSVDAWVVDPVAMRVGLNAKIYAMADEKLTAATAEYSAAEMSQWERMVAQAEAANWTYFDTMAGDLMTGQQYGEYVLAKHAALKAYFDAVLAARNKHKAAIAATADADLAGYDINLYWP